jgi:hypothetical protein
LPLFGSALENGKMSDEIGWAKTKGGEHT